MYALIYDDHNLDQIKKKLFQFMEPGMDQTRL